MKDIKGNTILFEREKFKLSFINNSILMIDIIDFTEIELEDIHEIRNWVKENSAKKKLFKIFNFGNGSTVSKELREFTSSEEASENTIAVAILVRSLAQQLLLDYYLKFNRPFIPTRAFSKKEKAIKWINSL